jgi:hypothetical protein
MESLISSCLFTVDGRDVRTERTVCASPDGGVAAIKSARDFLLMHLEGTVDVRISLPHPLRRAFHRTLSCTMIPPASTILMASSEPVPLLLSPLLR